MLTYEEEEEERGDGGLLSRAQHMASLSERQAGPWQRKTSHVSWAEPEREREGKEKKRTTGKVGPSANWVRC